MNRHVKHLMIATLSALLLSGTALACGDKPCGSDSCSFKSDKAASCSKGAAKVSTYKKSGHHNIPGNSPNYVRRILKEGDKIGLSEKQRKQIGELLVAAETGAARAHAEAQITVAEFRTKLHSSDLKERDIKVYAKRMGELRAAKIEANLLASVKAARLLSDEQKAELHSGKSWKGGKK